MLTLTPALLAAVVARAKADAAEHPRWQTAIDRAVRELESNPWIERDELHGGLLIGSPSGQVYAANGVCQCTAFAHGQPCWHRACAQLVRRHDEAAAQEVRPAYAQALAEVNELFA